MGCLESKPAQKKKAAGRATPARGSAANPFTVPADVNRLNPGSASSHAALPYPPLSADAPQQPGRVIVTVTASEGTYLATCDLHRNRSEDVAFPASGASQPAVALVASRRQTGPRYSSSTVSSLSNSANDSFLPAGSSAAALQRLPSPFHSPPRGAGPGSFVPVPGAGQSDLSGRLESPLQPAEARVAAAGSPHAVPPRWHGTGDDDSLASTFLPVGASAFMTPNQSGTGSFRGGGYGALTAADLPPAPPEWPHDGLEGSLAPHMSSLPPDSLSLCDYHQSSSTSSKEDMQEDHTAAPATMPEADSLPAHQVPPAGGITEASALRNPLDGSDSRSPSSCGSSLENSRSAALGPAAAAGFFHLASCSSKSCSSSSSSRSIAASAHLGSAASHTFASPPFSLPTAPLLART